MLDNGLIGEAYSHMQVAYVMWVIVVSHTFEGFHRGELVT